MMCTRRLRLPVDNVVGLTYHPNFFVHVSMEAHPVKQPCQDIQCRLVPGHTGRGNKAFVKIFYPFF